MLEKWMKVSVALPGVTAVDPSTVRRRLAAQNDNAPEKIRIPADIFNYNDSGHPLSRRSQIRFGGGKQFQIFACGDEAVDTLAAEGHKIIKLLSLSYHADLCEQRETGRYDISLAKRLLTYRIPMMIIQQAPKEHKALVGMDEIEKETFIEEKIRKGINLAMAAIGSELDLSHPEVLLGDVVVGGDIHPIEAKPQVFFLAARDVSFRTNLDIKGPVHVGHLISRGYGQVFRGAGASTKSR